MLRANSHPRHPRIAIRIREIDMARDKNIFAIRAARDQNKRRKRDQLPREARFGGASSYPKSAIRNLQCKILWARRIRTGDQGIMSPLL